nr:SAP domain-containing protein [Arthrobacter caoxuetaonis]
MEGVIPPQRPPLSTDLSETEFLRWYWLKEELQGFARTNGLSTAGSKATVSSRVAACLAGRPRTEAPARPPRRPAPLVPPLTIHTVVPAGHPCSQVLREFFVNALGPGFRFDAPMRAFFAANDGTATLAAALDHWHATRSGDARPIGPQFELNRFSRDWHASHPGGTRDQMLTAWKTHRSLPVDLRPAAPAGP